MPETLSNFLHIFGETVRGAHLNTYTVTLYKNGTPTEMRVGVPQATKDGLADQLALIAVPGAWRDWLVINVASNSLAEIMGEKS